MKYIFISLIMYLTLPQLLCFEYQNITKDPECDAAVKIDHVVLLVIHNVNKNTDTCTGALIAPSVVLTTGWCCHTAISMEIFAFYDTKKRGWEQSSTGKITYVYQKDTEQPPDDNLCAIRMSKPIVYGKHNISNVMEYVNISVDNSILDVIGLFSVKVNNSVNLTIVCRLAEVELKTKCGQYHRSKFNHTTWFYCITNAFTDISTCSGIHGAVIQHSNTIIGITRQYLENCTIAKYGFYHDLQHNKTRRFINMLLSRGFTLSEYCIGNIIFIFLISQVYIIITAG